MCRGDSGARRPPAGEAQESEAAEEVNVALKEEDLKREKSVNLKEENLKKREELKDVNHFFIYDHNNYKYKYISYF